MTSQHHADGFNDAKLGLAPSPPQPTTNIHAQEYLQGFALGIALFKLLANPDAITMKDGLIYKHGFKVEFFSTPYPLPKVHQSTFPNFGDCYEFDWEGAILNMQE